MNKQTISRRPIPAERYCPCGICQASREAQAAQAAADLNGTMEHNRGNQMLTAAYQTMHQFVGTNRPEAIRAVMEAAERYGDVILLGAYERYLAALNAATALLEHYERMKANSLAAYLDCHPELKEEEEV